MTATSASSGRTWVIADPHFGHANICKFTDYEGNPVRPWDDVDEMDAALIKNWNDRVHPKDRVYLLGDVCFSPKNMHKYIPQLNGRICLVPGNHEPPKMRKYFDLFDDVRGYVQRKGWIMSHIPLHPDCLGRWGLNIHGHLHGNKIDDPRYVCVSVEHTNYAPVELTQLLKEHGIAG